MFRLHPAVVVGVLICAMALPAVAAGQNAKNTPPRPPRHKLAKIPKTAPVPDPPPPPPPPATPEQMPAKPPQVSYLDGQLTIVSQNATLSDILAAVQRQTGAVIDLPPGAGRERAAGHLGPGPARDVLASLLNGSQFDYILLGSASNPAALEHVILTPRTAPAGGGNNALAPPAMAQPQYPQVDGQAPEAQPDISEQEEVPQENPVPDEAQQPPQPQLPQQVFPPDQQQEQQQPNVKTPEQLLQELQRMQQLQQQQQQQQPQNQPPQ